MTDGTRNPPMFERVLRAVFRDPEDIAYPLNTSLKRRPVTVDVIAPMSPSWFTMMNA